MCFKVGLLLLGLVSLSTSETSGRCFALVKDGKTMAVVQHECGSPLNQTWLADAYYYNSINQTGWSQLDLKSNPLLNDTLQAYYAGYLEGLLTVDLINAHRYNLLAGYCDNATTEYCAELHGFLRKNLQYATSNVVKNRQKFPYWHHVGLVLEQLQGLNAALQSSSSSEPHSYLENIELDVESLLDRQSGLWINLVGEFGDIEKVLGKPQKSGPMVGPRESCSAMVKLTPGNLDILVAHNTWTLYNFMLRVMKKYQFGFHETSSRASPLVPGNTVSMSSYPGTIFSLDDFYLLSSNLTVLETTIASFNDTLYKLVQPNQIVLEFVRNLVANRLASDGRKWTSIFAAYNSGTYNNQFMIIDYNKFVKGNTYAKDVLWIVEQMPGMTVANDVSEILYRQSYWPSYNRPYFEAIFNRGLWPDKVKQYGDYYRYNETARGRIFRRDHGQVVDLKSMYKLMRYNDFKGDMLSRCNCTPSYSASLTIAARGDLNDPNGRYNISDIGFSGEGAIDAKVSNLALSQKLEMIAVSSPTYSIQPAYQWSKTSLKTSLRHRLHPDLWNFKPVKVTWSLPYLETLSFESDI